MKVTEIKSKKESELQVLLSEKRIQLRELKFKNTSGRLSDNKAICKIKRDIARILTFLKEKRHA